MGMPTDCATYPRTGFVNSEVLANLYYQGVICNYGINDVLYFRTWVQLSADLQTIFAKMPGKPILQCTLGPKTTSSDGFTSATRKEPGFSWVFRCFVSNTE